MSLLDNETWPRVNGHFVPGRKYSAIKYNAIRRGIQFDVSIDHLDQLWIEQQGCCLYTGEPLDLISRNGATASLDRTDTSLGYVEGNVAWVHVDVNFAKHTLSEARFFDIITKIYELKERRGNVNIR